MRKWGIGVLSGLSLLTALYAESDDLISWGSKQKMTRKQADAQQKKQAMPSQDIRNTPDRPGLFLTADFLYWKAEIGDSEFATNAKVNGASGSFGATVDSLTPDFSWRPGFRAGLGWRFASNAWDLYAEYTYLPGHGSKTVEGTNFTLNQFGGTIYPAWITIFLGNAGAFHVSNKWSVFYNTLDLQLGRLYFITKTVSLRPHLGLQAAQIDQNDKTFYTAAFSVNTGGGAVLREGKTSFNASNDFKGIGLNFGVDSTWNFNSHWNLFGKIAAGLVEGRFSVRERVKGFAPFTDPLTPVDLKYKFKKWMLTTNLQAIIGFGWQQFFYQEKYRLAFSAGYEFTQWFDMNQFRDVNLTVNDSGLANNQPHVRNGHLSLQGLTFQGRFDF